MEDSIVDRSEASYRNSGVSDTLEHLLAECQDDVCRHLPEMRRSNRSMRSKASDGRLNTEFKFGGKPSPPPPMPEVPKTEKPMTLSDIIPPPSHYLSRPESTILDDESVFKSIMGHASQMPPAIRPRADSDSSSRRRMSGDTSRMSFISYHSRGPS